MFVFLMYMLLMVLFTLLILTADNLNQCVCQSSFNFMPWPVHLIIAQNFKEQLFILEFRQMGAVS